MYNKFVFRFSPSLLHDSRFVIQRKRESLKKKGETTTTESSYKSWIVKYVTVNELLRV
jgi:hypothetical protein